MKTESSPKSKKGDSGSPSKLESIQAEMNSLTEDYEGQIRVLKSSNDAYSEKITELELQLKLVQGDYERDMKELRTQISENESVRSALQDKVKQLEL